MNLDDGGCVFGMGVLLKHLKALESEFEGVHQGDADIEYIHRMRVATRRLRAALPLFSSCLPERKTSVWMKEIRQVTRALGAARDADVQIEAVRAYLKGINDPRLKPGVNRLVLRLCQQRAGLQPALVKELDRLRRLGTLAEMRLFLEQLAARAEGVYLFTQPLYAHACRNVTDRLDALLAFDAIVAQPDKVLELHEMRISAKWLRYTLETFAPLYPGELKEWLLIGRSAQDQLGEIHDCDVWMVFLPGFLEDEYQRVRAYFGHSGPYTRLVAGIQSLAEAKSAERAERFASFNEDWEKWREREVWMRLRAAIQVPFPDQDHIFPSVRLAPPSTPLPSGA